jgi:hypothetical protein
MPVMLRSISLRTLWRGAVTSFKIWDLTLKIHHRGTNLCRTLGSTFTYVYVLSITQRRATNLRLVCVRSHVELTIIRPRIMTVLLLVEVLGIYEDQAAGVGHFVRILNPES